MVRPKSMCAFSVSFLCMLVYLFSACKKELKSDVELSKKPVDVMKKYLAGTLELCYSFGGLGGIRALQEYPPGTTMVFKFNTGDSLFVYRNDTLREQAAIEWKKVDDYNREESVTLVNSYLANIRKDSLQLTIALAIDASTFVWARR